MFTCGDNRHIATHPGRNDVVINRGTLSRLVELETAWMELSFSLGAMA
jgi:hypothetical protein